MPSRSLLEEVHEAVRESDAPALRRLLGENAELRSRLNEPVFAFDSPAIVAVAGGATAELVDVLLEFGADPNARSAWWAGGFHALHSARGAVADRLLAAGAEPDACAAANLDRVDMLERMLAEDPGRVHERGGDGQTPLHFARSRQVVDLLLKAGADLNARDVDHRSTPAEWMIDSRGELARYFVERGAHADIFLAAALGLTDRVAAMLESDPSLLSLRTGQGDYAEKPPSSFHIYLWTLGSNQTPLRVAAKFGRQETLEVMRRFASVDQRLLLACSLGRGEEARAIVRENPGIVDRLSAEDRRALPDEAWSANVPAVELMLELGFDPAVQSKSGPTGGTALHCAAWEGSVESVAAILSYPRGKALVSTRDSTHGGTPLGWCCHGSTNCGNPTTNHPGVAKLLIAAGSPEQEDVSGCSAAVAAVILGNR